MSDHAREKALSDPRPYPSAFHEGATGDGWQPIETAPKDGSFFLGLNARGIVAQTHWCRRFKPDAWADIHGFYQETTHWIPLPTLPEPPPPADQGEA